MSSNFKITYSIFFVFFIIGNCTNDKNETLLNTTTISFDLSDWDYEKRIPSSIIKSIDYIPLETHHDCIIGQVKKIEITNSKIYIADRNDNFFVFSINGKFVDKIEKKGRGPGEFMRLNDFIIDTHNNQLLILDTEQRKILFYSLTKLDFLSETKLGFMSSEFELLLPNNVIFYSKFMQEISGKFCDIRVMNLEDSSQRCIMEKPINDIPISNEYSVFQSLNTYYSPFFGEIVYKISSDSIYPYILFDFGNNKVPLERIDYKTQGMKAVINLLEKEGEWSYGANNILETEKCIYFNINLKGTKINVIYFKKTEDYYYGYRFEGDFGLIPFVYLTAVENNKLYGTINSYFFKSFKGVVLDNGSELFKKEYLDVYNKTLETSNPIVVSVEFSDQ